MLKYFDTAMLPISIGLVTSKRSWLREMKRLKIKSPPPFIAKGADANMHSFDQEDGPSLCLVAIDAKLAKRADPTQLMGLIVHECVHVWQEVRRAMRDADGPSSEFEAYTVQWLTQLVATELSAAMHPPKKKATK